MSELTIDRTLADVVTEPGAARVLEGFGLDYCCGGRRTLADAVRRARARPDGVRRRWQRDAPGPPEPDWAPMARPSWSTTSKPPITPTCTPSCPG